jgi:hypothetical protein
MCVLDAGFVVQTCIIENNNKNSRVILLVVHLAMPSLTLQLCFCMAQVREEISERVQEFKTKSLQELPQTCENEVKQQSQDNVVAKLVVKVIQQYMISLHSQCHTLSIHVLLTVQI